MNDVFKKKENRYIKLEFSCQKVQMITEQVMTLIHLNQKVETCRTAETTLN